MKMLEQTRPTPERYASQSFGVVNQEQAMKRIDTELRTLTIRGDLLGKIHHMGVDMFFSATQPDFAVTREHITQAVGDGVKTRDEKLHDAVAIHRYEGVPSDSAEYSALMTAVALEQQVERQILRQVLHGENKLGFTPLETELALTLCDIADQKDVEYGQYHYSVIASPLAKKLQSLGKEAVKEELKQQGLLTDSTEFLYITFDEDAEGNLIPKNNVEMFPEPVTAAADRMTQFLDYLGSVGDSTDNATAGKLREFFEAWRDITLLTDKDPVRNDEKGKRLDETWRALPDSLAVLPYPGMEPYADELLSLRIDPETILAIKDERYQDMQQEAEEVKQKMIAALTLRYSDKKSIKTSLNAWEKTVVTFQTFHDAGVGVTHMLGGSNLPNRDEIRLAMGARISNIIDGAINTWPKYREKVETLLGKEAADKLYPNDREMIKADVVYLTAGHEVGHTGFQEQNTRVLMGQDNHHYMDEAKADLSIFSVIPEVTQNDLLKQQAFLRMLLSRGLIVLTRVADESSRPYYNSGLIFMKAMTDCGLLEKKNEKWTYDDSNPEKIASFFDALKVAMDDLVEVYDNKSPDMAQKFQETYFVESPAVIDILKDMGTIQDDTDPKLARNRKVA